jgi:mannose-6-phosphate isomerase
MAMKLETSLAEKPWGRDRLPPMFGDTGGRRIGEVWFTAPQDLPLLVKYIFTSERLSIQVHPNDEQARSRGLARGKNECWLILEAEPGATLGLGLEREVSRQDLRSASLDGSIERLVHWRPVRPGDFFQVPAGTVHAIGAGISLLEFQQNADVTYRLYDYGRPRELHLDEAVAVADPAPYPAELALHVGVEPRVLVTGPHFTLVQPADGTALQERRRWVVPIEGQVSAPGVHAAPGECLLLEPGEQLDMGEARVLIGAEGPLDERHR